MCDQQVPQIKLPRTGIDQVFIGERPRFIEAHREFERIANVNVSENCQSSSSGCQQKQYKLYGQDGLLTANRKAATILN